MPARIFGTAGHYRVPNTPPAGTPSGFVYRVGQSLFLNGSPYRMIGFNIWRAASATWNYSGGVDNGYHMNDGTILHDALANINAAAPKANVFRFFPMEIYALGNGNGTGPGTVRDWTAIDKVLSVAGTAGWKVVACLEDEWDFHYSASQKPAKDSTWFSGGYATTPWTGTSLVAGSTSITVAQSVTYRAWVQEIVNRYKNDNRIAAWELMNEPEVSGSNNPGQCPAGAPQIFQAFVKDIAGLIKSIDPYHLVSIPMAMKTWCGVSQVQSDYQAAFNSPYVDICCTHDYSAYNDATSAWTEVPYTGATSVQMGMDVRSAMAANLNKPIYVGEFGMHTADVGGSLPSRASYIDAKMAYHYANYPGVVGHLLWDWYDKTPVINDFNFGISDPVLPVISKYGLP